MPTLHLMVGLPASGKTTFAQQLERDLPALRLSPDEWMARVVGDGYDEDKRAVVEAMLTDIAIRVLELGADAILDFGFWGRGERDAMRDKAGQVGADMKIHFLDVPREELHRRIDVRNADLPEDTFHVTKEDVDLWLTMFEAPTPEELAL